MFEAQSIESPSTGRTATDLIMHTVTKTQKTDLLEALKELFSQENLDKYQMTETHWQDIFLILLNSYLRLHALNRKEIFKRLTDKLHELRIKEQRRSSGFYASISIATPPFTQMPNLLNEMDTKDTKQKEIPFSMRSSFDSINSGRSPNESEYSITPAITGQLSIARHENLDLRLNKNLSTQSLSPNHIAATTSEIVHRDMVPMSSMKQISDDSSDGKPHLSMNSNAIIGQQRPSIPIKRRRYRITVIHNDVPPDTSSHKLPSIVSKNRSSQTKQSTITGLTDYHPLRSSSTTIKRIRNK